MVYGESDGLPGLVIDRYGSQCVVQIGTAGMERLKPQIQEAVLQVLECETLLFKNDGAARELEGLPAYVEAAKGSTRRIGLGRRGGPEIRGAARSRVRKPAGSSIKPPTDAR